MTEPIDRDNALRLALALMEAVRSHYRTSTDPEAMINEATYALGITIAVVLGGATEEQAEPLGELFRTAMADEMVALGIAP